MDKSKDGARGPGDFCDVPPGRGRSYHFGRYGVTVRLPGHLRARRVIVRAPGRVPRGKKALGIHVIRAVADIEIVMNGRRVTKFDPPLTLVLNYTAADARTAHGASRLKVFFYDRETKLWAEFAKPKIDRSAKTATVKVAKLLGEHDPVGFEF